MHCNACNTVTSPSLYIMLYNCFVLELVTGNENVHILTLVNPQISQNKSVLIAGTYCQASWRHGRHALCWSITFLAWFQLDMPADICSLPSHLSMGRHTSDHVHILTYFLARGLSSVCRNLQGGALCTPRPTLFKHARNFNAVVTRFSRRLPTLLTRWTIDHLSACVCGPACTALAEFDTGSLQG